MFLTYTNKCYCITFQHKNKGFYLNIKLPDCLAWSYKHLKMTISTLIKFRWYLHIFYLWKTICELLLFTHHCIPGTGVYWTDDHCDDETRPVVCSAALMHYCTIEPNSRRKPETWSDWSEIWNGPCGPWPMWYFFKCRFENEK